MFTHEVNRAALTVIPRQPFIDWVNLFDQSETVLPINDPGDEVSVYLVDEVWTEADVTKALKRHYATIFAQELAPGIRTGNAGLSRATFVHLSAGLK